jgi:hypothetical protein
MKEKRCENCGIEYKIISPLGNLKELSSEELEFYCESSIKRMVKVVKKLTRTKKSDWHKLEREFADARLISDATTKEIHQRQLSNISNKKTLDFFKKLYDRTPVYKYINEDNGIHLSQCMFGDRFLLANGGVALLLSCRYEEYGYLMAIIYDDDYDDFIFKEYTDCGHAINTRIANLDVVKYHPFSKAETKIMRIRSIFNHLIGK